MEQGTRIARPAANQPLIAAAPSRVDMHCHSVASRLTKPEVRKALLLGECATEPEALYELAKRRGMDFVTITDHDTIDGALRIADLPDVFVSEELTARFKDEPREVHVLCYGIDPDDHARLQERAADLESCAEYLQERGIVAALAHPFWEVEEPLTLRHRRRLAQLFPIWEVRSGYFGTAFNAPARAFRAACGGVGIGGSDDHGGIHVGLTYTETPSAGSPQEFLKHVRAGLAEAGGEQGNRLKLAQATAAIGLRSLPGALGRAAGALASRAPRVRPRMAPAPEPAAPEPLADVVGLSF
jgi:predicted metal-dependent phosphoesterase TrpH